jgi:predicted Zn-dependent protease
MKSVQKIVAIGVILILAVSILNPAAVFSITVKEEEDMSHQMMAMIYKYFEIVDDPAVVSYVNNIGNRILSVLPQQPFKYRFYVIKDDVYNAFATPAGHIFVYTGLLDAMEEEEELAGILGHEIAHVAGIAAGVLLGVGGSPEAGQAVAMGSMAAGQSAELSYSRENEMQADELGLKFITEAGYNVSGLLKILKKIRSKTWFGSDQIPKYLMTHPAVEDRIAYISSWLDNYKNTSKPIPLVNQDAFNRVYTWVETRYGDEETVLSKLKANVARNPQDPLAHHRYGLILARVGKRQEAIEQIRIALTKRAFDPYILRDLGWVYFLDGQFPQALKTLESAGSMIPGDPECLFYLSRTQMEMGNLAEASDNMLKLTRQQPDFTQAYYFLGKSLGQQQKLGDAHFYLGVFYLKKRDLKNASVQLKQALKYPQDDERRKKIDEWLSKMSKKGKDESK